MLYGSYLRGTSTAMPDFYLLLSDYPSKPRLDKTLGSCLPPNVYYFKNEVQQAKVTVLRTRQLLRAVSGDFHPYFWCRFAQPNRLLYCRDDSMRERLHYIRRRSAERLVESMQPLWAERPTPATFWQETFKHTYAAELRSEGNAKYAELYEANAEYYGDLLKTLLWSEPYRANAKLVWLVRIALGKLFSFLRLLKSAITFEDPVGYMLWKVERHSGVRIEASVRARRHPFIFGWGLVWRLYRRGAFR